MKIAIYGADGASGYFAGRWAEAGLRDVAADRRTELAALAGAIVRLGAATPVHELVYAALRPQVRRDRRDVEWP